MRVKVFALIVLAGSAAAQVLDPFLGAVVKKQATAEQILPATVATLPSSPPAGTIRRVTDGDSAGDCTTGSGSTQVFCVYNGSAWAALGDGNSGAAPSFADIENGTAAGKAFVLGAGTTLTTSGGGLITAPTITHLLGTSPTDAAAATFRRNDVAQTAPLVQFQEEDNDLLSYIRAADGAFVGDVAFTPAGGIAATDVQAAIEELDGEKAPLADPVFTGSVALPQGTGPTTNAVGEVAFDTNAWGSGRGALQVWDGTANTYAVATLASDTPTNGQCPKWNTGGTVTWEDCAGGAGLSNVSEDTSPTLGGNLDGGGFTITNLESITLTGDPFLMFPQGAACTPDANAVCIYPATSIATAYGIVLPSGVGSTGVVKVSVSGAVATLSHAAIADADVPNNITIDLAAAATALAADPTDCTDQFARGINASGTAQCANVATADISNNAVTRDKVSAALRTRQVHFKVWGTGASSVLQDTDDELSIFNNQLGSGITITEVVCESDTGTPSIQLQRDDGSAADILGSALSCATTPASTTTFSGTENQIADGHRLDFLVATAGGAAHWVAVTVVYTVD